MILFRYLAREVLVTMLAVSSTLLLIAMSSRFVKYLAEAASGVIAPDMLLSIMAYRVPSFLEQVLPMGLFIGILLAYGRLYVESEMTVMTACGISTRRLSLYTLMPAALVAVVVGCLSLYVSPAGINRVQEIFQDAKNSTGLELLVAGRFRTDSKTGRVTYIESLSSDRQQMQQVFFAEPSADNSALSLVLAEQGRVSVEQAGQSRYLVLKNGYRYIGTPGQADYGITRFDEFGQLIEEPEAQSNRYKKADARPTRQLLNSTDLEDRATLQWRISLIVLVPIIALIAQALSKTSHRRGRYVKMLPAFLIYIFYLVLLNAARDAIEKQKLSVELGMWWVHGLFLLLALMLLFGGDAWRQINSSPSKELNADD